MYENIAIILASGTGERFGENIPKQFYQFEGKTLLEHAIDAFEKIKILMKSYWLRTQNLGIWQKIF